MPVPVGLGPREGLPEPYPDPPEVAAVRSMLNRKLRVRVTDGRVFVGYLNCFDKSGNILLNNSVERPSGANGGAGDGAKERHVGYILITPDTVVETHLHAGDGASGPLDGVAHTDAIDGLVNLSLVDHPPPNVDLII
jgi:small nuclear ribonucleoprotein (snRNP)-like protein